MTLYYIFFFNDTATTEIYTLSLHDALPIFFTEDHGEMNGAHRLQQKGAIHFDEAAIVNLTAVVPGGPQGKRTSAVGSHLDLAPTLLEFAGLSQRSEERRVGKECRSRWSPYH